MQQFIVLSVRILSLFIIGTFLLVPVQSSSNETKLESFLVLFEVAKYSMEEPEAILHIEAAVNATQQMYTLISLLKLNEGTQLLSH